MRINTFRFQSHQQKVQRTARTRRLCMRGPVVPSKRLLPSQVRPTLRIQPAFKVNSYYLSLT
jgi:hypothetical protein